MSTDVSDDSMEEWIALEDGSFVLCELRYDNHTGRVVCFDYMKNEYGQQAAKRWEEATRLIVNNSLEFDAIRTVKAIHCKICMAYYHLGFSKQIFREH